MKNAYIYMTTLALLSGCATSNHGSFVPSTYIEPDIETMKQNGCSVIGVSRQTWFLYVFPIDKAPSTDEAISDAKSKIEGTKFLTDLSIDDRIYWKLGYSEQVIEVTATAYK